MKILICHQYYKKRGGEDTVFELEVELLKSQNHQCELFSVRHQKNHFFTIIESALSCLGISYHLWKLKKKINEIKPDVIRFHNIFPLITTKAFRVAKKNGAKTQLVLHNYRPLCINALRLKKNKICNECIEKKSIWPGLKNACYNNSFLGSILASIFWMSPNSRKNLKFIDEFVCLSEASKQIFSKNIDFPTSKIKVNPNFFIEKTSQKLDASHKKYTFAFIGRISKEKGIDIYTALAKKYSSHHFAIAGQGPLLEELKKSISKENLKNIFYLGFSSKEEVKNILSQSRALIVPSLWEEVCPMVILEAYSCGVPVISTHFGGQAELVKLVSSDLLFNPSDLESFDNPFQLIMNDSFYESASESAQKALEKTNKLWNL